MASSGAVQKALSLVATLVVVFGVLREAFHAAGDPHRCGALIGGGKWLDPVTSDGARQSFTRWQPDGCMLHEYSSADIHACLEDRHMLFIGDSTTRQVFWAMARQLDEAKANELRNASGAHEDYDYDFDGARLVFHWNPFLQFDTEYNNTTTELKAYQQGRQAHGLGAEHSSAAAIFIGTGAWFAAHYDAGKALDEFSKAYTGLAELVHQGTLPPLASQRIVGPEGVGPQLFVAPPVPPTYSANNPRVADGKDVAPERVLTLQKWLTEHEHLNDFSLLQSFPALVQDQDAAIEDPDNTGFHVVDSVANVKANIVLNARCNAKLDRKQGYPYDRTCCTDYGSLSLLQILFLALGVGYLMMCTFNETRSMRGMEPTWYSVLNLDVGMFVTALLACFWTDRTQAFAKGSKAFVSLEFSCLCAIAAVVAVTTFARSAPPRPRPGHSESNPILADAKPLSRDQTDEWKGWMQAVILIYHWTGGSRILGIYVGVRLLVAAYLFQTGFGHAVFFISKRDFSFRRVASVLLRLNLLSCALPFVMHTEYMFYYFAPLVTFWFLIVYAVFAVGSQHNDNPRALLAKGGIAAFICPGLVLWTPLMDWTFAILRALFHIQWDLYEWKFRLGLDGLVVYIGVLMGVASVQTKLYNHVITQTKSLAGLLGAASIVIYWWASTSYLGGKKAYNQLHPYISFVPILGFIALRNINPTARVWYSRGMAWLGRCSLETFTLQFHIFLASDTKGVLRLGLFEGDGSLLLDRWRDLIVIAPMFLWLSWRVAEATNGLVKLIMSTDSQEKQSLAEAVDLDLESKPSPGGDAKRQWWQRILQGGLRFRIASMLLAMWLMNLAY